MLGIETTPKNKKLETTENDKKVDFNLSTFLELCKKNKKLSIVGKTKDGVYQKIRLNKNNKSKIIWYCKSGKQAPVLMWSTLINRNCRINNLDEAKKTNKSSYGD